MGILTKLGNALKVIYVVFFLSILVLSLVFYQDVKFYGTIVLDDIEGFGWWGNIIVIGLYLGVSLLVIAGAPAVLSFFCGLAYGLWFGLLTAGIGTILSTTICFLAGRTFLRGTVEKYIKKKGTLAVLDQMVKERGFLTVVLVRVAIFPPSLMNYFLSITSVSFTTYFFGTLVGMTPGVAMLSVSGTFAIQYATEESLWLEIGLIVSVIFTVVASVVMTIWARRAIKNYKQTSFKKLPIVTVNREEEEQTEKVPLLAST